MKTLLPHQLASVLTEPHTITTVKSPVNMMKTLPQSSITKEQTSELSTKTIKYKSGPK